MSPLFKRILTLVLLPVLLLVATLLGMSLYMNSVVTSYYEENAQSLLAGSINNLKNQYYSTAENESKAVTRERALQKAIRKRDRAAIPEIMQPTFNRLSASNIIDGLFVTDLDGTLLYSSDDEASAADYSQFVKTVIDANAPSKGVIYAADKQQIRLVYSFPLYVRGKLKAVAQYTRDVSPLLDAFSGISNYQYGLYVNEAPIFFNWEFDAPYNALSGAHFKQAGEAYSLIRVNYQTNNEHTYTLIAATENTRAISTLTTFSVIRYSLLAVGIVLLVLVLMRVIKGVSFVMRNVSQAMEMLAEKEFALPRIEYRYQDEIQRIIKSLHVLKEGLKRAQQLELEEKEKQQREVERAKKMRGYVQDFETRTAHIIETVAAASTQLSQTAQRLSTSMTQAKDMMDAASQSAGQTTQNVQTVAAAADEMSSSTHEIATQVHKANEHVSTSLDKVEQTDRYATTLMEATNKVGDVTKLIADIAGQINLLALNATIESARAGDAGRGFAVVASEVKSLATQTNNSIQDIAAMIDSMNTASDDIQQSLADIRIAVEDIHGSSSSITVAIEGQTAATQEVATNMQSAAGGSQQITSNIHEITSVTHTSMEASQEVLTASKDLSIQAETLRSEVDAFLGNIQQLQSR